jgi:hypothetical protein
MPPKAVDLTPLIWAAVKPLFILTILIVIATAIYAASRRLLRNRAWAINTSDSAYPYASKKPLTETEQIFFHRLRDAMPECVILAQVQLSSIIGIDKFKAKGDYYKWLNPIVQQSVDYLVCLPDFTIVAAVELDDKSHWGKKSRDRDNKKDKNLAAAGITLLRWHAEAMPSVEKIRHAFDNE